jgi:hypothetical protein
VYPELTDGKDGFMFKADREAYNYKICHSMGPAVTCVVMAMGMRMKEPVTYLLLTSITDFIQTAVPLLVTGLYSIGLRH